MIFNRKSSWTAFLSIGLAASASADVVTISSSHDTTIFGNNTNNSAGGFVAMFSGTDGNASVKRALVKFDVASNVPAGSTITSVQLTLYLAQVAGMGTTGTETINLHLLTADWGEGTNGTGATLAGGGQGFPAHEGDATWANRFYSTNSPVPWTTPGGDFISTISAQTIVGATTNTGYSWLSTATLVSDVQGWLDNSSSNFGWLLQNSDEVSTRTFRAFFTREETNSLLQPQLQITFTPPPPQPPGLAITMSSDGQLQITASNLTSGVTNYLQASTNFTSSSYWASIQTNVPTSNTMVFTGLSSTNAPFQFYRLLEVPQN